MKMNAKAVFAVDGAVGAAAYYEAAKRFPMLSHEKEIELARLWRDNRDQAAADKIVNCHLRYVISIAMKYRGYGAQIDDLIAEGNVGLVKALERFDPERGFRFSTYASWWIRAAINDFVIRDSSLVKTGTTADQKKLFFKLRRTKARLGIYEDGDLLPESVTRISKELGVNPADVILMNRRLAASDASLNKPANDTDLDPIDTLVDNEPQPDQILATKMARDLDKQLVEVGLAVLNDREKDILTRRHLVDPSDALTLEDLGNVYGVTRERIRQIEAKALQKFGKAVKGYTHRRAMS